MSAAEPAERRFKVVVLGTTGVGKTCLTLRFVRGIFEDDQLPTIGAAYLTKSIRLRENTFVYELWDTAGQERYDSITPLYYRTAQAAIIAFDVNDKGSFQKAKDWLARLRREMDCTSMPIALAANKFDSDQEPLVDMNEAEGFALENHMKLFKVSAKSGKGVDEMFQWLALSLPPVPGAETIATTAAAAAGGGRPGANLVREGGGSDKKESEMCCS